MLYPFELRAPGTILSTVGFPSVVLNSLRYFCLALRQTNVSRSFPLPGRISPRSSRTLIVLRFTDTGRIDSPFFKFRRIGSDPSESVPS